MLDTSSVVGSNLTITVKGESDLFHLFLSLEASWRWSATRSGPVEQSYTLVQKWVSLSSVNHVLHVCSSCIFGILNMVLSHSRKIYSRRSIQQHKNSLLNEKRLPQIMQQDLDGLPSASEASQLHMITITAHNLAATSLTNRKSMDQTCIPFIFFSHSSLRVNQLYKWFLCKSRRQENDKLKIGKEAQIFARKKEGGSKKGEN